MSGSFQFGVLLISDKGSTDSIPSWADESEQVTASGQSAVVRVRHAQDGEATVRIWFETTSLLLGSATFSSDLEINSGCLVVSDALGDLAMEVQLEPGIHRIDVFVDAAIEASEIDVVIDASGCI